MSSLIGSAWIWAVAGAGALIVVAAVSIAVVMIIRRARTQLDVEAIRSREKTDIYKPAIVKATLHHDRHPHSSRVIPPPLKIKPIATAPVIRPAVDMAPITPATAPPSAPWYTNVLDQQQSSSSPLLSRSNGQPTSAASMHHPKDIPFTERPKSRTNGQLQSAASSHHQNDIVYYEQPRSRSNGQLPSAASSHHFNDIAFYEQPRSRSHGQLQSAASSHHDNDIAFYDVQPANVSAAATTPISPAYSTTDGRPLVVPKRSHSSLRSPSVASVYSTTSERSPAEFIAAQRAATLDAERRYRIMEHYTDNNDEFQRVRSSSVTGHHSHEPVAPRRKQSTEWRARSSSVSSHVSQGTGNGHNIMDHYTSIGPPPQYTTMARGRSSQRSASTEPRHRIDQHHIMDHYTSQHLPPRSQSAAGTQNRDPNLARFLAQQSQALNQFGARGSSNQNRKRSSSLGAGLVSHNAVAPMSVNGYYPGGIINHTSSQTITTYVDMHPATGSVWANHHGYFSNSLLGEI